MRSALAKINRSTFICAVYRKTSLYVHWGVQFLQTQIYLLQYVTDVTHTCTSNNMDDIQCTSNDIDFDTSLNLSFGSYFNDDNVPSLPEPVIPPHFTKQQSLDIIFEKLSQMEHWLIKLEQTLYQQQPPSSQQYLQPPPPSQQPSPSQQQQPLPSQQYQPANLIQTC